VSLSGIVGSLWIVNGPLKFTPKSGFCELRYRVYQLRSTFSLMRFVSRPILFAPSPGCWAKFGSHPNRLALLPSISDRHSERLRDSVRDQYCRQCTGACHHQGCSALQCRLDSLLGPRPTRCIVATGLLRSTRRLPQIGRVPRPLSEASQCFAAPPAQGSRYPTRHSLRGQRQRLRCCSEKNAALPHPASGVEHLRCLRNDFFQ
jgi:hypothetical protein